MLRPSFTVLLVLTAIAAVISAPGRPSLSNVPNTYVDRLDGLMLASALLLSPLWIEWQKVLLTHKYPHDHTLALRILSQHDPQSQASLAEAGLFTADKCVDVARQSGLDTTLHYMLHTFISRAVSRQQRHRARRAGAAESSSRRATASPPSDEDAQPARRRSTRDNLHEEEMSADSAAAPETLPLFPEAERAEPMTSPRHTPAAATVPHDGHARPTQTEFDVITALASSPNFQKRIKRVAQSDHTFVACIRREWMTFRPNVALVF